MTILGAGWDFSCIPWDRCSITASTGQCTPSPAACPISSGIPAKTRCWMASVGTLRAIDRSQLGLSDPPAFAGTNAGVVVSGLVNPSLFRYSASHPHDGRTSTPSAFVRTQRLHHHHWHLAGRVRDPQSPPAESPALGDGLGPA